jgi:cell division protein ZapA (FtsZ GTPase activity inhibitor)
MSSNKGNERSIEVVILGQRMTLKVDDDRERVERLAAYVSRKADELTSKTPLPPGKAGALLALNIADDYFRALDEARELKQEVARKSRALLSELES